MKQGLILIFFLLFSQSFFASDDESTERSFFSSKPTTISSDSSVSPSESSFGQISIEELHGLIVNLAEDVETAQKAGQPITPMFKSRYDALSLASRDFLESALYDLIWNRLKEIGLALGASMMTSSRGYAFSPVVDLPRRGDSRRDDDSLPRVASNTPRMVCDFPAVGTGGIC